MEGYPGAGGMLSLRPGAPGPGRGVPSRREERLGIGLAGRLGAEGLFPKASGGRIEGGSGGGDMPGELGCVCCCGDGGSVLFVVNVATVCDLAAPDESGGCISCIGFTSSVSSDASHLASSSPPLEQLSSPFSSSSFSGVNTAPLLASSVAEFAAPS